MFESFTRLVYAVLGLGVFCDIAAIAMLAWLGDRQRMVKLLDLHIEVFAACASSVVGVLRVFRRREPDQSPHEKLPPLPRDDTPQITHAAKELVKSESK